MTMTSAQLAYVRDCIGDDEAAYRISDSSLNAIFDDTTQGNSNTDRTNVFALRRLLGKARRLVALSGEFGNAQHNQQFEQTERLLTYWEGRTGMHGGVLSSGVIDLVIDEECSDGADCDD